MASREHVDEPLEFEPFLRPQIWGGDALCQHLGKVLVEQVRIGESWEVSGLPEHPSVVTRGAFTGQSLADLWTARSEDLAGPGQVSQTFPLFVKWLDCHEYLSIQVHPDDDLARESCGQISGKSEAWVVVRAEPTARIFAGLKHGVTQDELLSRLANGTVVESLHSFVPKVGDCISLPAGTLHSAGGGLVVAEVQQPSDTTFRLFDWNRQGLDGQPRALHREMALRSINWTQGPVSPTIPRPLASPPGVDGEWLLKTPIFELERYTVQGTWPVPYPGQMTIWMILDGSAFLKQTDTHPDRILNCGSTVLIPAAARGGVSFFADSQKPCQLLCIRMPEPS